MADVLKTILGTVVGGVLATVILRFLFRGRGASVDPTPPMPQPSADSSSTVSGTTSMRQWQTAIDHEEKLLSVARRHLWDSMDWGMWAFGCPVVGAVVFGVAVSEGVWWLQAVAVAVIAGPFIALWYNRADVRAHRERIQTLCRARDEALRSGKIKP